MAEDPLRRAFDPRNDPARFDALVAAIVRDAMAARAALRPRTDDLADALAAWARPALLAAAASFLVAVPTLLAIHPRPTPAPPPAPAWETLGLPQPLRALLVAEEPPTASELSAAMKEGSSP